MHYPSLCLAVVLMLVHSESGRVLTVRLCGSNLIDALNLLCGGRFNGPDSAQSDTRSLTRSLYRRSYNNVRRGIADECCHKSCSIDDMRSYCEEPSNEQPSIFDFETEIENTEVELPEEIETITTTTRPNIGTNTRNLTRVIFRNPSAARRRNSRFYYI